jgi:hypothetical protein
MSYLSAFSPIYSLLVCTQRVNHLLWSAAEGEAADVSGHQVDVLGGHGDEVGVAVQQALVGLLQKFLAKGQKTLQKSLAMVYYDIQLETLKRACVLPVAACASDLHAKAPLYAGSTHVFFGNTSMPCRQPCLCDGSFFANQHRHNAGCQPLSKGQAAETTVYIMIHNS